MKAMRNWRTKYEFGGKFPKQAMFPFVRDVPVALLDTERGNMVRGAAGLHVTVNEFLVSLIEERFLWSNGAWFIATP